MQTTDYWRLFKPSACSVALKATDRNEVFPELVKNLVRGKMLKEEFHEPAVAALEERERLASTGVGKNVAIPHVKLDELEEVAVSLSIHEGGIEWSSLDGSPVHVFFTVLRPAQRTKIYDPDRHLDMMRWISQLSRDGDFRNFARGASNRTELVELLKEMSTARR